MLIIALLIAIFVQAYTKEYALRDSASESACASHKSKYSVLPVLTPIPYPLINIGNFNHLTYTLYGHLELLIVIISEPIPFEHREDMSTSHSNGCSGHPKLRMSLKIVEQRVFSLFGDLIIYGVNMN